MFETHHATDTLNAIWKLGLEIGSLPLHCGLQCSARLKGNE